MTAWLFFTSLANLDTMQLLRALIAAMSVAAVVFFALRMAQPALATQDGAKRSKPRGARFGVRLAVPKQQTLRLTEVTEDGYRVHCNGPKGHHQFLCESLSREVTCPHCGTTESALELTQRRVIEQGAERLS